MNNEIKDGTEREARRGLEFNFDGDKLPKTALVFEETDDAEACDEEEISTPSFAAEANEEPETPVVEREQKEVKEAVSEAPAAPRSVEDEEFEIPDTFVVSEEFDTPLDNYVSTICKTYVPRFTEVTANHNYFADNSLLREKEKQLQREKEASVSAEPRAEQSAPSPVSVTVEDACGRASDDENDPTAEVDHEVKDAVVVSIGSSAHESELGDTLNVFKFPEEHEGEAPEEESEEERTKRVITKLTGHRWDAPKAEDAPLSESDSDDGAQDSAPAYSTDSWSNTVPDDEKLSEVYAEEEKHSEKDDPKGVSTKKVSASDTTEYNSFAMRDVFKDRFLDSKMAVKLRLIVAALLGVAALLFENLYLFGVELFGGAVISVAVIDACLIAALFMIALPEALRGIKAASRGILAPEICSTAAILSLFAYTLTMSFIAPEGVSYPLFGFVAAILSFNSMIATHCMHSANFEAFKSVSEKGIKHVYDTRLTRELERENMALDGAVDEYKSKIARGFDTGFISDFVTNSGKRYENTRNNAIVLAVSFGVALVAGVVMLFVGELGAVSGLSTFALVIALASPAFAVMSHKLPFARAEREVQRDGGAIIGERTMYDFAGVDVVAFEDTEVFGTDDVSFKSISLSDRRGDFNEAMRKMSSLFAAIGGPLSNVFAETLNKKYPAAEDVIIEDDGAEGTIDGKRVMAGNVDYMVRHGVKIPLRNESSVGSTRIMYAAEDGELFAKFTVNYAFSEEFALMLSAMRQRGIVPLVYTRDFNVNNEFLQFLTSGADAIRVMRRYSPDKPRTVYGRISAGFVTLGDKTSFVNMLLVARRYVGFQSRIAVTEALAAAVGATLAAVIALCNMTTALPSALLGGWQLVWTAVLAIISARTFNKQDKDSSK